MGTHTNVHRHVFTRNIDLLTLAYSSDKVQSVLEKPLFAPFRFQHCSGAETASAQGKGSVVLLPMQ